MVAWRLKGKLDTSRQSSSLEEPYQRWQSWPQSPVSLTKRLFLKAEDVSASISYVAVKNICESELQTSAWLPWLLKSPAWMRTSPFGSLTWQLWVSEIQTILVLLLIDVVIMSSKAKPIIQRANPRKRLTLEQIRGTESVITSVDLQWSCLRQLLFFSEYGNRAHVKWPRWFLFPLQGRLSG